MSAAHTEVPWIGYIVIFVFCGLLALLFLPRQYQQADDQAKGSAKCRAAGGAPVLTLDGQYACVALLKP